MRAVLAVVAFAFTWGVVFGQPNSPAPPTPPAPPAKLPPLTPPPALPAGQPVSNVVPVGGGDAGLPGGTNVSQPLQPVAPLPGDPTPAPLTAPIVTEPKIEAKG